jgi:hypothetical protein
MISMVLVLAVDTGRGVAFATLRHTWLRGVHPPPVGWRGSGKTVRGEPKMLSA